MTKDRKLSTELNVESAQSPKHRLSKEQNIKSAHIQKHRKSKVQNEKPNIVKSAQ